MMPNWWVIDVDDPEQAEKFSSWDSARRSLISLKLSSHVKRFGPSLYGIGNLFLGKKTDLEQFLGVKLKDNKSFFGGAL